MEGANGKNGPPLVVRRTGGGHSPLGLGCVVVVVVLVVDWGGTVVHCLVDGRKGLHDALVRRGTAPGSRSRTACTATLRPLPRSDGGGGTKEEAEATTSIRFCEPGPGGSPSTFFTPPPPGGNGPT